MKTPLNPLYRILGSAALMLTLSPLGARVLDYDIFDREESRQHYLENKRIAHGIIDGEYIIGSPEYEDAVLTYLNFYLLRGGATQVTEIEYIDPEGTDPDAWNLDYPSGFQPNYRPVAIPFGEPTDKKDWLGISDRGWDNTGFGPVDPHRVYLGEYGANPLFSGNPATISGMLLFNGPKGQRFEEVDIPEDYISDAGYMAFSEFAPIGTLPFWEAAVDASPGFYSWFNYLEAYGIIRDWEAHDVANPEHTLPIWETADIEITLDGVPIPREEFRLEVFASKLAVGFLEGSPTLNELRDRPYHDRVLKFSFKNVPTTPYTRTMEWEYDIQGVSEQSKEEQGWFDYLYHKDSSGFPSDNWPVGGWNPETGLPNQRITGYVDNGVSRRPIAYEILDEDGNVLEVIENKAVKVVYEDFEWTTIIYDEYVSDGRPWHERNGWQVIANLGLAWNIPADNPKKNGNWFYLDHPSFAGWYWTKQGTWPAMYSANHNAWLYWGLITSEDAEWGGFASLERDAHIYTWLYNYSTQSWEASAPELRPANEKRPRSQWLDLVVYEDDYGDAFFPREEEWKFNQLVVPIY